jgi:hypothetical protein
MVKTLKAVGQDEEYVRFGETEFVHMSKLVFWCVYFKSRATLNVRSSEIPKFGSSELITSIYIFYLIALFSERKRLY